MAVTTKDERIFLRVVGTRKEMWRRVAEEDGRRLSDWIRWLADRRVAEVAQRDAPDR